MVNPGGGWLTVTELQLPAGTKFNCGDVMDDLAPDIWVDP